MGGIGPIGPDDVQAGVALLTLVAGSTAGLWRAVRQKQKACPFCRGKMALKERVRLGKKTQVWVCMKNRAHIQRTS